MIYILTGCDCVGKTTIVNQLKKEYKEFLFYSESYCGKYFENRKFRLNQLKFLLKKGKKNNFVFDRCTAIEDHIYEPIINNKKSLLNVKKCKKILNKCKIIYIEAPDKTLIERMKKRGDEYVNEKNITQIKESYINFFKKNKIKYTTITSDENAYQKIKKIIGDKNEK